MLRPITRSKARALEKANILIDEYLSVDPVHETASNEETLTSTILAVVRRVAAFVNCNIIAAIEWLP